MANGFDKAEVIDPEVDKAFAAEDYVLDQQGPGVGRDYVKMRAHAFDVIKTAKVLNLRERADKAVTRNTLITKVFPHLPVPPPKGRRTKEADLLAAEVWRTVDAMLWGETKIDGALQQQTATIMGNGYVLCRCKAGLDNVDAVYITDDIACIEADYIGPDNEAVQRLVNRVIRHRMMLVLRRPDDSTRILRGYDRFTKRAITGGHDQLVEAIEAAKPRQGTLDDLDDDELAEDSAEAGAA